MSEKVVISQSANADTEAAREQRKKKRTKCFLYIVLFIIFQTAVITLFALTVMKSKTPKFRVRETSFASVVTENGTLQVGTEPEFSVKNTNFGRYKYRPATVEFFYGEAKIGESLIPSSKVGWRSTKRFYGSEVQFRISSSHQLSTHLSSGSVPIRSSARMTGRVELMFILKKNRDTNMDCTMDLLTDAELLTNIRCD